MTEREALKAGLAWLKGRYERDWKGRNRDREIEALLAAGEYRLSHMPVRRECLYCGQQISDTRRADAKFCSDQHRIDWNSLKRSEAGQAGLRQYAAYLDRL